MSRRAEIWQKLLQIRNGILQGMQAILGTWPGLITITLLLITLAVGLSLLSRSSTDASAQSPGPARLAQIATRVPTRAPITPRPTYTSTPATTSTTTSTPVPTQTVMPTATRRQPTPTWTPFATATAIAASPLSPPTEAITGSVTTIITDSATVQPTAPMTRVVPLPAELTGPQVAPVEGITVTQTMTTGVTATDPLTETNFVTETVLATETPTSTEAITDTTDTSVDTSATATPTLDVLSLLVPTPTPTNTPTISEALEQPISPAGMAGMVATATAVAPGDEGETLAEGGEDAQIENGAENGGENEEGSTESVAESIPLPAPTADSQPTPDGNVRTARVPVLMYHYISVPPAGSDIYRQDLSVTPQLLAEHLDALQQAGYTTISLYAFYDNLMTGAPLPEKPVVLTFDDGYVDNYTNAYPLLRERGMTATFFLVTDFINDGRPEYVTWDMVREMYAGGMSIEGHGRNHISLANKDSDYLIWQALGTYESIEHEIGVRPRFISYPAGEYDQRTIDVFRSAGYWAGFTTKQGATHSSDDLFRLLRIRIRGTTTAEELLRILTVDW